MIRKLLWAVLVTALWRSAGTPKTRATEARLNAAMPRIPWPQADPGPANNSSYGPGNSSYPTGDGSYNVSTAWNAAAYPGDNGGYTGWQQGGNPTPHYHPMQHGHNYGNLANDFNALRDSHANAVSAFNNHINDHGALVNCISQLRADHSNLLNMHNDLRTRLSNAKILT